MLRKVQSALRSIQRRVTATTSTANTTTKDEHKEEPMTIDTPTRINQISVVGTLDTQRQRGKDRLLTTTWNAVQGREDQITMQVRSAYGTSFRLPIHLEGLVTGREVLDEATAGTPLAIDGALEWIMTTDPRYALDVTERGRRASEVIVRAQTIRLASADDEPGGDVWLIGRVLTPIRTLRHTDKPLRIALTTLQITQEQTRTGSRARIFERANISVAIPIDHPDAVKLFRPNNVVVVEGMLERVTVLLSGQDVDRAVQVQDEQWAQEQERLQEQPAALRTAERSYGGRRRRLLEAARTRVVAGYVELLQGEVATLAEALAIRKETQRQRQANRRGRADHEAAPAEPAARRGKGTDVVNPPSAIATDSDPGTRTLPIVRPRRRSAEPLTAFTDAPSRMGGAPDGAENHASEPITDSDSGNH
jgi:hypothetical protein